MKNINQVGGPQTFNWSSPSELDIGSWCQPPPQPQTLPSWIIKANQSCNNFSGKYMYYEYSISLRYRRNIRSSLVKCVLYSHCTVLTLLSHSPHSLLSQVGVCLLYTCLGREERWLVIMVRTSCASLSYIQIWLKNDLLSNFHCLSFCF